jgi:hypothetical protein
MVRSLAKNPAMVDLLTYGSPGRGFLRKKMVMFPAGVVSF